MDPRRLSRAPPNCNPMHTSPRTWPGESAHPLHFSLSPPPPSSASILSGLRAGLKMVETSGFLCERLQTPDETLPKPGRRRGEEAVESGAPASESGQAGASDRHEALGESRAPERRPSSRPQPSVHVRRPDSSTGRRFGVSGRGIARDLGRQAFPRPSSHGKKPPGLKSTRLLRGWVAGLSVHRRRQEGLLGALPSEAEGAPRGPLPRRGGKERRLRLGSAPDGTPPPRRGRKSSEPSPGPCSTPAFGLQSVLTPERSPAWLATALGAILPLGGPASVSTRARSSLS